MNYTLSKAETADPAIIDLIALVAHESGMALADVSSTLHLRYESEVGSAVLWIRFGMSPESPELRLSLKPLEASLIRTGCKSTRFTRQHPDFSVIERTSHWWDRKQSTVTSPSFQYSKN